MSGIHKIREEECRDEDDDDVVENLVMRGSCCVGFVFLSFFCGSSIAGRAGWLAAMNTEGVVVVVVVVVAAAAAPI